jgi:signal peptide peptidase SppA
MSFYLQEKKQMNSIQLISAILRGKWLVEPNYAITQGSVIASILNKQASFPELKPNELSAFAIEASNPSKVKYSYWNGFDKAPAKSIAVISLRGALMKNDMRCGESGMATIGNIIRAADSHHNIDAIVLSIDSPGGTVDGTETLANIVKATSKPIISYVDGLMASAALWVGSSADEIFASTDTDEIGSVGVLMSFMDIQPYYEKQGVKFHTITASTSPEKTNMWEDLRAGKYDAYIKEVLDPLDEKFMATIRENCPGVEDKHLSGKVFFAKDVLGVFVDKIATLDDAILRASELASLQSDNNSISNTNTNSMKQFKKLNATLNVDSLESVDDSVSLNEDQLQSVETALEETDTVKASLATAKTDLATANTEKETAENALSTAMDSIDAIDETVKSAKTMEEKTVAIRTLLSGKPGSGNDGVKDKKDPEGSAPVDADWEAIDKLEHNQID